MPKANTDPIKKLQHNQILMIVMILSLVVTLIWIVISLFASQNKTELPKNISQLTDPLNPSINRQVLEMIEAKRFFSEEELAEFPIYKIIVGKGSQEEQVVTIDINQEDLQPSITPTVTPTIAPSDITTPSPGSTTSGAKTNQPSPENITPNPSLTPALSLSPTPNSTPASSPTPTNINN